MKRIAAVLAMAVMLSGCCTSAFIAAHDARIEQKHLLRAMQAPNGNPGIGIDMADLTGWWAAMKESPVAGTAALLGDTATAVGGVALGVAGYKAISRPNHDETTYNVGGDLLQGTGNYKTDRHDSTSAGSSLIGKH